MSVNEKIKIYRQQKKISQRELGRRINKTGQLISSIERGETTPSMDTIKKIAIALDVSLISLLDDPSEIIDKSGVFIDSSKSNNEHLNFSDNDIKELSELICNKYENVEMFNKLFKSAIFEERYDYKFEELGSKYIAELYNFMAQMIEIKINEIKYKKNSK